MPVTLLGAARHKPVVARLNQLYLYDFSEFGTRDVGPDGLYEASYLDAYWSEEDRHPFLFIVGGQFAGFALVIVRESGERVIGEFFVMWKYRRKAVRTRFRYRRRAVEEGGSDWEGWRQSFDNAGM